MSNDKPDVKYYCGKYTYVEYMRKSNWERANIRECHRCLNDIKYINNKMFETIPCAFNSTEEDISFKALIRYYQNLKFSLDRKKSICKKIEYLNI